jgi:TP901 family phage tail tape measure protein
MAILGSLQVRMGLDTATFGDRWNSFTKDLQKRASGFQRSMAGLTSFGNLGASLGAGAGLAKLVDVASEFEGTMNRVAGASGATAQEMGQLTKMAREFGTTSIFSANEAAEGMLELTKAGLNPAQIAAGALKGTMQLASTEGMELGRAATIVTDAMGAFSMRADQADQIVDALAGASIASTAGVQDLAQGLAQCSAVASLTGQNINSTAGALALFASNGVKGSDAGTSLKTMLLRLNPATDSAAAAMEAYNLKFTDSQGKFLGLAEVAELLKKQLGGLTESQRTSTLQTIFGTDAMRAAAILTREGAAGLNKYVEATQDKMAAEKLSDANSKGFAASMKRLRNAFSGLAISIAEGGLLDALTGLALAGVDLVNKLSGLPTWAKNLGVGFAAAAVALPPFALALTSIVSAVPVMLTMFGAVTGFLLGPWGLAIGAAVGTFLLFKDQILAGVTSIKQWFAGWVVANQGALASLRGAWEGLKAAFGPLVEALAQAFQNFKTELMKAFGGEAGAIMAQFGWIAATALTSFVVGLTQAIQWVTQLVQWLTTHLPAAGTAAGQAMVGFVETVRTWFGQVVTFMQPAVEAWKSFNNFLLEFGKTFVALGELIATAVQVAFQKVVTETEFGKGVMAGFRDAVKEVGEWCQKLGTIAAEAFGKIADSLKQMWDKAAGYLQGLRSGIEGVTKTLKQFTGAGEEAQDKATEHSWLKDLCLDGVAFFQQLVTGGIHPAMEALKKFTTTGNQVKPISFTSEGRPVFKAMEVGKDGGPKELEGAWKIALDNVGSAIDDFVKSGKLDFKSLVQSFVQDLASSQLKKAAEALFGELSSMLSGAFSGSGGSGGSWGNVLGSVFKAFGSFEGGGYTGGGNRSGGLDGRGGRLAMLHPQETVIDHTRIRGRRSNGRGKVEVNAPITLMPGVSHQELAAIIPQVQSQIIQIIPELIARGGSYAAGFRP